MKIQQHGRLAELVCDWEGPALFPEEVRIEEKLGNPFLIDISAFSEEPGSVANLIGSSATVYLNINKKSRCLHGYVETCSLEEGMGDWSWHLRIRPWIWQLTKSTDCRIFQNLTIPGIIEEVFRSKGFDDFRFEIHSKNYRPLEYCTQYRETHFNFVHRLLEREGMTYCFSHDEKNQTLIFIDDIEFFTVLDDKVHFLHEGYNPDIVTGIRSWNISRRYVPTSVTLSDYNFAQPRSSLVSSYATELELSEAEEKRPGGTGKVKHSEHEIFEYPGKYDSIDDGDRYARIRSEEISTIHEEISGTSNILDFSAGIRFEVSPDIHKEIVLERDHFLITEVTHFISQGGYRSNDDVSSYTNRFRAVSGGRIYRPRRITPKPVIQGPQTAIVVGPEGEEIYTDEYGRIKVQFHWDRYGKRDENSSCWIRVAQMWAGKRWGAVHLPRVGQEVIVEFLDGDPDRPIVTGRVYNGEQMPPYALPDQKNKSGVKSHTVQGGASSYNEILFDDTKGAELFSMRAQKDMNITVNNDYQLQVVEGKYRIDVADKNFIAIHEDEGEADLAEGIYAKSRTASITLNAKQRLLLAAQDKEAKFGSVNANAIVQAKQGLEILDDSGGIKMTSQNSDITIRGTKTSIYGTTSCYVNATEVTIDATAKIVLKCGASTIELTPASVTINGPLVKIN